MIASEKLPSSDCRAAWTETSVPPAVRAAEITRSTSASSVGNLIIDPEACSFILERVFDGLPQFRYVNICDRNFKTLAFIFTGQ